MQNFLPGDYVRAAWITNSNVKMAGRVERVTKTRVFVRGRDATMPRGETRLYQFNAQDKGTRFRTWDGYTLHKETREVCVDEKTGAVIACGDTLEHDGYAYRVEFLEAPHRPGTSGRVYVKRKDGRGRDTETYYVSVFGLVWINCTYRMGAQS